MLSSLFLYLPSKVRTYFGSCPLKSDCKNPSLYEVSGSKNDDGNLKKTSLQNLKKEGRLLFNLFQNKEVGVVCCLYLYIFTLG